MQCVPSRDKNKLDLYIRAMKFELYNFGDSTCELDALVFIFRTVIGQSEVEQ